MGALQHAELLELARRRGGIIGVVNLTARVDDPTAGAFADARENHRNEPDWSQPDGPPGFVFQDTHPIAYHPCPGQTMFIAVDDFTPAG